MATRWLDLADDLLRRLPEVHTALRGGELDDSKARVLSGWTRELADDHAHHVCTVVLPEAPGLPVGALIERIQQVATALDPAWAARREHHAAQRKRVLASRNPTGTANLCGHDLPVDRTVIAMARVEALAAELRRRGVTVGIETLRAEVYLHLIEGTAAGLSDDALLDLLTTQLGPTNTPDTPDPDDPDKPDGPGPDGPDDPGPDGGDGPNGPGEPDGRGPDDSGGGHDDSGGGHDDDPGDSGNDGDGPRDSDDGSDGAGDSDHPDEDATDEDATDEDATDWPR
jgi:hypothetical protein